MSFHNNTKPLTELSEMKKTAKQQIKINVQQIPGEFDRNYRSHLCFS